MTRRHQFCCLQCTISYVLRFGHNQPQGPTHCNILLSHRIKVGRNTVVGVKTRYGLNGPENESRWGRDFRHPSRPALRPTQPPVQLVSYLFPAGKAAGAWR
jgi:hypothetical protein